MTERVGKPMHFVYVASRADGAHKIGVTGDVEARIATLSKMAAKTQRPILLVSSRDLGMWAPLIEKVAHGEMATAGYSAESYEWFEAPAEACILAVCRAIDLINQIGPDGWRKRRVKSWAAKRRLRES